MNVVDCRCETDDDSIFDGNSDVVAMVREKFGGQFRINRVVEYPWGDVCKNGLVATVQHFDFDSHVMRQAYECTLQQSNWDTTTASVLGLFAIVPIIFPKEDLSCGIRMWRLLFGVGGG